MKILIVYAIILFHEFITQILQIQFWWMLRFWYPPPLSTYYLTWIGTLTIMMLFHLLLLRLICYTISQFLKHVRTQWWLPFQSFRLFFFTSQSVLVFHVFGKISCHLPRFTFLIMPLSSDRAKIASDSKTRHFAF